MVKGKVSKVQLDVCFEDGETIDEVIKNLELEYGIEAKVVAISGPGGGWPVVEFSGDPIGLEGLIRNVFCDEDLIGEIEDEG